MCKFQLTKNNSLNIPLNENQVTIYGMGEVQNSIIHPHCIIGEFSRIRDCIVGSHVRIDRNNLLKDVNIGDYSYTGPFDMIFKCNIGKFTSISYGVTIGPPEHDYSQLTTHPFLYDNYFGIFDKELLQPNEKLSAPLAIGSDVWIGCNSTILRGINIGDGAVVGANSLVNKDIPPYAIVAGCPAKIIKYRFSEEIIEKLQELKWWMWPISKIKANYTMFSGSLSLKKLRNII